MKDTLKKILLSKNILFIDSVQADRSLDYDSVISSNCGILGAILKTFGSLGYSFDKESILRIAALSRSDLKLFYNEAFDFLGEVTGLAYNTNTVLFPEFPDIDNLSVEDMFFRNILHYLSVAVADRTGLDCVYIPTADTPRCKVPFDEQTIPTVLRIKTHADQVEVEQILASYFKNYLSATVAIPNVKKVSLEQVWDYFIDSYREKELMPEAIPFKENIVYFFGLLTKQFGSVKNIFDRLNKGELEFKFLKTITDYLRLYTYLSVGQFMIGETVKYKTFSRSIRRWFLKELNTLCATHAKCAEFASHRDQWIHVFEKLHPGDYSVRYANVYKAASDLRGDKLVTFNSEVENAFYRKDSDEVVRLLSQRPGLFARSLDRIVRNDGIDTDKALTAFSNVSANISSNVILQLYNFYLARNTHTDFRTFLIKQENFTKLYGIEDERQLVKTKDIHSIHKILANALVERQKVKTDLEITGNKVWLDESMKKYTLPVNNRAVSENIKSIPSGSYLDIQPDKDVLRLFTHWKNGVYRVDIDLACIILGEDFSRMCEFSWRSYRSHPSIGLAFSGDITDAPHGANEFIDINYKELKSAMPKARYVVITNNVYTGQAFKDIPECFSGVMFREKLGKTGEVFESSTVATKFNLTQDSSCMNIAGMLDLETMRFYYIDQPLNGDVRVAGTIVSTLGIMARDTVNPKLTMYDLVKIAARSKQFTLARKPETADYVISDNDESQLSPWDQELFVKLFM